MVASFSGENSFVNITSSSLPNIISSMVIQFKTSQSNSQIAATMSERELFAVDIQNGYLKLQYDFSNTENGSISLGTDLSANLTVSKKPGTSSQIVIHSLLKSLMSFIFLYKTC